MNLYLNWVESSPIISAMVQFALLGTLGEIISCWIVTKSFKYPFTIGLTLWKMLVCAVLAIAIKYAFKGFAGFLESLIAADMWPEFAAGTLPYALSLSLMMNLQFGLFLVIIHRVLDNIPLHTKNWKNLDHSMYSLLWFWIPAHTITFLVPDLYKIGLAALWSVALGLILGFYNSK